MKHTLTFLFSLVLVLSSWFIEAQTKKTDSIPVKTNRYGIRVGFDLFKLARTFYEEDYKGLEVVGDYRLTKKYYLAGELGNENKTVNDDQLNFTTKGTYFKAGADYNLYENWLDMENMVYIGARYGVSSFSQTLNSYTIYNRYPYFGQSQEIKSGEKFNGLSAQWVEVLLGVKAKVINNFYVGFSFRMNKLVSNKKPDNFDNLYIPGFNRTYDGTFGAGFNYTVSYFIPIYKKKVPVAAAPKKK
ncbi:DUF6048 family protein [Flavobacterium sp.]|uniref:DUF6048 family protein n=1 Tax=Flavobacterium sp. TaxID=239 RepID=UPI00286CF129|nr:DUF6048 family protein [Flavobacterium sp.]